MWPRDVSLKPRNAALVVDALIADLLLGEADGGDLRHSIDAVGKEGGSGAHRRAEGVARRDAALLHGGRGEAGEADHIAHRIDVRHGGLEGHRIDREPAAGVEREPGGRGVEIGRRSHPAGGEQHHLRADAPRVVEDRHRPAHAIDFHMVDLASHPKVDAALAQLVGELLDDLAIDELQKVVARLDDRHRDVERREDRRVLQADDAGADDGEAAWHAQLLHQAVAVDHGLVVEGDVRRAVGLGPHRDDDVVGRDDVRFAARLGDGDGVGVDEAGRAAHRPHAVARELVLEHVDLVVQGLVQAGAQVAAFDVLLHPVGEAIEAALPPAGEIEHGLAKGLGGDGAGVHRDPAHPQPVLDHQHRVSELGGLDGGAATRGSAADHDQFVAHRRNPRPCRAKPSPAA